jgi:predicted nucleotidyltransferase
MDFNPLIQSIRTQLNDVLAIYAFGSRVQNQDNAQSDLDLAVLLPKPIPPLTLWEIASSLSGMVNCPVDLIDLRNASTVMQYQIVSTGIRLWEKKQEGQLFEVFVCNDKLDLDARRKDLLIDIQHSGRIYDR